MRKTLFPNNLKDITCIITDDASKTKSPPAIKRAASCFVIKLIVPKNPPNASEPVSPINILAGGGVKPQKTQTSSNN